MLLPPLLQLLMTTQYVEFLQMAVPDATQYTKLLPPMEVMHSDYRLDPEAVFALWRPALQLLSTREAAEAAGAEALKDEEMEEGEAPAPHSTGQWWPQRLCITIDDLS